MRMSVDEGALWTEAREGGRFQVPEVNLGSGSSRRTAGPQDLRMGEGGPVPL